MRVYFLAMSLWILSFSQLRNPWSSVMVQALNKLSFLNKSIFFLFITENKYAVRWTYHCCLQTRWDLSQSLKDYVPAPRFIGNWFYRYQRCAMALNSPVITRAGLTFVLWSGKSWKEDFIQSVTTFLMDSREKLVVNFFAPLFSFYCE